MDRANSLSSSLAARLLTVKKANSLSVSSPTRTGWRSLLGLGLILVGSLLCTVIGIWIKILRRDKIPFTQVLFVRYAVIFLIVGACINYKRCYGKSMSFFGPKKHRVALLIRACLYFSFLYSYCWSLMYISLGLATIIVYTFPLFTAIISHWGCCSEAEKLSKFGWLCTLCSFAGTSVVLCSGEEDNLTIGVILSLVSSISWALQFILIRRTREEVHWFQIEFLTACMLLYILTPCVWIIQYILITYTQDDGTEILKLHIEPLEWCQLIIFGTVSCIALGCVTLGFQMEEAPRAAIIMYLDITFSILAQWVIFNRWLSLMELCGVGLVLVGTVSAAVEKFFKDSGIKS